MSVYADRMSARRATAAALAARLDRLSTARLVAFLLAVATAGVGFGTTLLPPWVSLLPLSGFLYLVAKFEMTRGRKAWADRAAGFYAGGLDRLAGKPGGAADGARFADDAHPYAADLDLFGPGSVFQRLTACRTRVGEDTLAAWLLAGADPAEVKARQEAVADLAPRLDLREAVAVAGSDVPAADYRGLAEWGAAPVAAVPGWKRWAVEVLGWANVLAAVGWLFADITALPVLLFGLPSLVIAVPLLPWARRVLAPLDRAARDLSLLEAVLARLERETFAAARLRELQAAMAAGGLPASAQIRELRNLLGWYDGRRNPLFMPVALLRMWGVRFAFKLEAWRGRSGPAVGRWVRAVGEAEALSSLAGYAFENPADVFPTVEAGPVRVVAVGVGHPLIPADRCVRNDVTLGAGGPRVLLVSGSNMSGKSTLLRAVGVNAVLALAGGVVRAVSLALTPVAVGATMRVQDSLQAGRSRFFAEVTKVRQLLDIATAGGPPLLFLLDELFSGTNSADRVAGAEGVVRALAAAGAVGFVTTHDLTLTAVADRLPGTVNVHFCDGFAGGEPRFDYTMRPGVVPHGNGLALMRAVGLEV
ncbi:MAG: DNA mismatch repair protein MutS [Isosphaera sp.]|nr:DNA mismatch repair protein MutS [Isosphaera sp.]